MRYSSPSAFRQALERRLRDASLEGGLPLVRLRKTVAFDRLLARLVAVQSSDWLLKGGLALQLRTGTKSRTTKDIDLHMLERGAEAREFLIAACRVDAEDWFEFEVGRPSSMPGDAVRLPVTSRLDGRVFESFHVDIARGDVIAEPLDRMTVTDLLAFADIPPTEVPCYPVPQQVAEKLHALTLPRGDRDNSRVKDLVDLVLLAEAVRLELGACRAATAATFAARATHALPEGLPEPPSDWAGPYRRLAAEAGLADATIDAGMRKARSTFEPIMRVEE